ncbi:MAG: TIM barrel protein [Gemmatimonadetes bacterium]|nr:TIM barrel protein [Gemmatimonadota bacterium]
MKRREFLESGVALGGAIVGAGLTDASRASAAGSAVSPAIASALRHSVCRWPYSGIALDDLARAAARLGLESVELLDPEDWATVQRHGLTCAMANAPGEPRTRITHGFNRLEHHERLVPAYRELIEQAAAAGVPNVICFSGNRAGLADDEGLEHCARGLTAIMGAAERHGVNVVMELLNSKVDHADYQCDHTAWGVSLARRVGSERFRLLYDIYHMQIMEGDVIRTIRENHEYIAHYHTGGVPGRHEIDGAQELNYRAIMQAIADTGFEGYVGQEFIPQRDPVTSLAEAIEICRV